MCHPGKSVIIQWALILKVSLSDVYQHHHLIVLFIWIFDKISYIFPIIGKQWNLTIIVSSFCNTIFSNPINFYACPDYTIIIIMLIILLSNHLSWLLFFLKFSLNKKKLESFKETIDFQILIIGNYMILIFNTSCNPYIKGKLTHLQCLF
jgi:hypothetical protein